MPLAGPWQDLWQDANETRLRILSGGRDGAWQRRIYRTTPRARSLLGKTAAGAKGEDEEDRAPKRHVMYGRGIVVEKFHMDELINLKDGAISGKVCGTDYKRWERSAYRTIMCLTRCSTTNLRGRGSC